jgi:hypothetical protein
MTERAGPLSLSVYQLRVVLRGISPLVWRRLLVHADSTIADLHEVLQVSFGRSDVHLHRFEIRGREYGISYLGGIRDGCVGEGLHSWRDTALFSSSHRLSMRTARLLHRRSWNQASPKSYS